MASERMTRSISRAPMLWGLFGKTVVLQDDKTAFADETYIRESILNPLAKVVAGYKPIMPTYRGQVTEEEIIQLIRYIQSMKAPPAGPEDPPPPPLEEIPVPSSNETPAKNRALGGDR